MFGRFREKKGSGKVGKGRRAATGAWEKGVAAVSEKQRSSNSFEQRRSRRSWFREGNIRRLREKK